MVGRVFVRTVLVAIMAVMVYLLNLIWSMQFSNIGRLVILTLIDSAVLLAALSLLIESFRSFGTITVNKNSLWFVFSGLAMVTEGSSREEANVVYTRNCELFWARSFMLAFGLLIAAAAATMLYLGAVNLVLFLRNPHTPNILWGEVARTLGMVALGAILFGPLFWSFILLEKKLANSKMLTKSIVLGLYICITVGAGFGALLFFTDPGAHTPPLYTCILLGIIGTIGLAFSLGMILAIAYGLYKLVGLASTRFPVLGNVWNTLCPVQTINFVK